MKSINRFLLCLLLFLCVIPIMAQDDVSLFTVNGVVKDFRTKRVLSYATVTVLGTNIGTVTNADGVFALKGSVDQKLAVIEISHIGYQTSKIVVSNIDQNEKENVFYLSAKEIVLGNVMVSPVNPSELVAQAVSKISTNYSNVPAMYAGFYRETVQKRKKYINISEAVVNVYKTSYTQSADRDRVKILKGRRLISPNPKDTLSVALQGGPNSAIFLDMVKNPGLLLSNDCLAYYRYEFVNYVSIENRLQYVISFVPRVMISDPLYQGIIYIDKESLTITRIEFNLEMTNKEKVTDAILQKKPFGLHFSPISVTYLVSYRRMGNLSYLNYVRAEVKFKCDWKKKIFHTNYGVVSEMVMTDRKDNPVEKISGKESFRDNAILSKEVKNFYDANFWGGYNIIEPTESLEHAVARLKKLK
jgi:hypothetical protein